MLSGSFAGHRRPDVSSQGLKAIEAGVLGEVVIDLGKDNFPEPHDLPARLQPPPLREFGVNRHRRPDRTANQRLHDRALAVGTRIPLPVVLLDVDNVAVGDRIARLVCKGGETRADLSDYPFDVLVRDLFLPRNGDFDPTVVRGLNDRKNRECRLKDEGIRFPERHNLDLGDRDGAQI